MAYQRKQSQQLFGAIVQGELAPKQLDAALISMKVRGEHPEQIAGALLAATGPFPRPDYDFDDIVCTGGDGSNSINIFTTSAIVAAACGTQGGQARQPQRFRPLRLVCCDSDLLVLYTLIFKKIYGKD